MFKLEDKIGGNQDGLDMINCYIHVPHPMKFDDDLEAC